MKYVTCMGALWKLTDTAWLRYARDAKRAATGNQEEPNLDDYGKLLQACPLDVTDNIPNAAATLYDERWGKPGFAKQFGARQQS